MCELCCVFCHIFCGIYASLVKLQLSFVIHIIDWVGSDDNNYPSRIKYALRIAMFCCRLMAPVFKNYLPVGTIFTNVSLTRLVCCGGIAIGSKTGLSDSTTRSV